MSLISDPNFLIHQLRLAYLREVDDPYGARIISLDPSYHSNPYIRSASLADAERWPELTWPESPNLSDDEEARTTQLPRSRLNRVRGERRGQSASRVNAAARPVTPTQPENPPEADIKNFVTGNAPVQDALSTSVHTVHTLPQYGIGESNWTKDEDSEGKETPEHVVRVQEATPVVAPVTKVVQFVPKFKGAAEMEARRRIRMAARRGPGAPPPPPVKPLTFDSSSSEGEVVVGGTMSDDSDFEHVGVAVTHDMSDEFDPVLVTPGMVMPSVSASDDHSNVSAGNNSTHTIVSAGASTQKKTGSQAQLHPESEHRSRYHRQDQISATKPEGNYGSKHHANAAMARSDSTTSNVNIQDSMFAKKKVAPIRPIKSALTAKLASETSLNPFTEIYGAISGRAGSASTKLRIYFPHAQQPLGKAFKVDVRRDATVEEVIGFALWNYWEQGWLPKLDDGLKGSDDPRWEARVSAVGWVLRITENDGKVDDDCPAPDRTKKATDFSDVYAVLEATPTQIQQNQIMEGQIQRRPSGTSAAKRPDRLLNPQNSAFPIPAPGTMYGSALGSILSTSLGPSSGHGPQVLLRIHTTDAVQIRTTVQVSSGMYLQEVLELVCQKRRVSNPNEYAFLLADKSILIPLDRTVASLQGKGDLSLVRRSMLPQLDAVVLKGIGKTTDPNASIFKRISETPEQKSSALLDYTAAYKKYTVYRRIPMLVTRQERTLAIDGDYIHIMPSNNRARVVFESGKTSSYHLKSIANCQQSAKTSSTFKLILSRTAGSKRYDFEADSPKLAAEIVQTIKTLKSALERPGTLHRSRKSRHIMT